MDLVTLIAACALSTGPNNPPSGLDRSIMHALIFEQSGGEPWSFSVPGEGFARVLPTLKEAIHEARAVRPARGNIHVGLAGLATQLQSVTALMFAPCPNITLAARQIIQLAERCRAISKPDPIYCAVAVYHGSWDRPDTWFANAVRATVQKGNAPNFDMPIDVLDGDDIAAGASLARQHAALTTPILTRDDRVRGWSSALFPPKSMNTASLSTGVQERDHAAEQLRSISAPLHAPATDRTSGDNLFVPLSSEPKP
jgi:hypothetical protein